MSELFSDQTPSIQNARIFEQKEVRRCVNFQNRPQTHQKHFKILKLD